MCGILFSNFKTVTNKEFQSALKLIIHRGPDASIVKNHNGTLLGHTRLKIQDLRDVANQPYYSKDRRFVIIYNGEVYNFKELVRVHNLTVFTDSDTEVLLALYVKLGRSCLELLNGMFAFVIYDTVTGDIFAARDRLGIKPLYVVMKGNEIAFSSEVAPLLAMGIASSEWDEFGVRQYKKLRTFFNGRTLYKEIKMIGAGSYFWNGDLYQYWSLPITEQAPPGDDELYSLVNSSVAYRCIADVSIGSFLSGGLDSSIIAGLAGQVHSWTVGYEDNNEFQWSDLVAAHQGLEHHKVLLNYKEYLQSAKHIIRSRKEPLSVPNEVLLFNMCQKVKVNNTVVLSGEGADELMFGYDRIFRWANENSWNLRDFDKLYSYGSHQDDEVIEDALVPFMKYGSNVNIVAAFFQIAHLHGLLRRLDSSSMLCAVEARVPFVDHRLVERMAGVSYDYRNLNGVIKAPLKRIFSTLLPQEVIERKKVGFPVNLQNIFSNHKFTTDMDAWLNFNLKTVG